MSTTTETVKVDDEYEQIVGRAAGRRVRVIRRAGLTPSALRHIQDMKAKPESPERDAHIESVRQRRTYFYVKIESHPLNENAVGRVTRVTEHSLVASARYKKVSKS